MAGANAIHTKHQKLAPEKNQDDPNNKLYYHFLYKAALVAIFFVILPMFPSQAPDFINQSLVTRNWELLHILFVGIAISYGLFSRKNDEKAGKENNGTKFDNAQTLVSRFLQVSSFFEDEAEITPSSSSNESAITTTTTTSSNKVQTWNNQHYRKEPVVVVANQQQPAQHRSNFENKGGGGGSGSFASGEGSRIIGEKPLLLPVRSLKSRLCDDPHVDDADEIAKPVNGTTTSSVCLNRSNSNSNKTIASKRFSPSNSMKTRNGELEGPGSPRIVENTKDSNVVLPSPIPWRSRSGKEIETPTAQYPSSMEESEFNKVESRSVMRSQTYSRSSRTSPVSSAESVAKNSEKVIRKVVFCKSCPPPPPPPPPMFQKSVSMKPLRYGSSFSGSGSSFDKELKRSFTSEGRRTFIADNNNNNNKNKIKNMDSFSKSKEVKEQFDDQEPRRKSNKTGMGYENKMSFRTDKFMPEAKAPTTELAEEEEEEKEESFLDKGMMENDHYDDEDDNDDESSEYEDEDVAREARMMQKEKVENLPPHVEEASKTEEEEEEESAAPSSDVDKKADEFIAKFREQIRLQRIESIKRSTRTTRKSSR
ncbi:hypothetical protein HN51_001379 [Arachis hypogaea]|uniref:DUF4408 domain-containing protein n=1 Tax=Arachis hypogaea TaxID=3818 RepID=A0A445ERV8_ARAHY|nr:uncharacterized protein DDB_G0284459 [Arachis hypogaea]QHO49454.1 uncharacterized protein DS421_1g14080 [Arachis hypogaea]RYR78199.1 hypothetical protein Ahy_A01g002929 [Arachis hypogaea]